MDDLLNNAPCGFLAFADDGTILMVNATLLDLLGYEALELQGRHIGSLLAAGGRVFYQTHFFPLLRLHSRAEEIYLRLRSKRNEDVPALVNAVRRERGGTVVNECIFVPVRQRSKYEDELLRAKKAAEEAIAEAERANRREHNIATQLQEALQPALPDRAPGLALAHYFEPALRLSEGVGGDFYDVFTLETGCTALVVGDLSGKGLAAAAQVATVRNMLRAFLYTQPTVAEAITTLNQVLADNEMLTGFATLFAGAYDSATGSLRYVNCGQEPALVKRVGTIEVEELGSTGPVLGAVAGAQYTEARVTLAAGDALAVFSDGLTESGASRANMLGLRRVASLFAQPPGEEEGQGAAETAQALIRRLMGGVEEVSQGGAPRDDMCLLVGVVEVC